MKTNLERPISVSPHMLGWKRKLWVKMLQSCILASSGCTRQSLLSLLHDCFGSTPAC